MKYLRNFNPSRKKILVRVDFNVPKKNNEISDDYKIVAVSNTINHLIKNKNKVFLLSHFGRPEGRKDLKFSLKFLIKRIKKIFKLKTLHFINDCIGVKVEKKIQSMNYGEICLLENVRFYKQEQSNDINFSKKLSKNFDYFVNDAFSVSHRSHSSIVGITKFLPSCCGYLFENEILSLENFYQKNKRPNMAIIGGFKVSTKILLLKNLVMNLDYLIIAGGMANTFLAAKGYNLGKSFVEKNYFSDVKIIEKKAKKNGCTIILPSDVVTANNLINANDINNSSIKNIKKNQIVFDIGPNSCARICKLFNKIKTVLWNGPLGAFEYKPFDYSTITIAKKLASVSKKLNLTIIVGGGDTISSIRHINVINKFSYVSTSGGAFMEWLEGKELPGIKALKKNNLFT